MFNNSAVNDNLLAENVSLPFLVEKTDVRGRFVRLGSTVDKILSGHNYPEVVSTILAELLVVTTMIGTTLKNTGLLSIQIQGDGPISLMVADYNSAGHLRGYAEISSSKAIKKNENDLRQLFGKGTMVLTLENTLTSERYQGIVNLHGKNLATCVKDYFHQSVQRQTELVIDSAYLKIGRKKSRWYAAGIILQPEPPASTSVKIISDHMSDEGFKKAGLLLKTVKQDELLSTETLLEDILYRLFHEDDVRVYAAEKILAKCRCSRKKVEDVLKRMDIKELNGLKDKKGVISVKCQFCGKEHDFTDTHVKKWTKK